MSDNEPRFRLEGRTIFQRPIKTTHTDGRKGVSLGFPVCEVEEHVTDPNAVLQIMNTGDAADDMANVLKRVRDEGQWVGRREHGDLYAIDNEVYTDVEDALRKAGVT